MESLSKNGVIYVTKMKKNLKYEVLDKEYVGNNDGKVEALIKTVILRKYDNKDKVIVEHKARLVEYWRIDKYGKRKHATLLTNDFNFHYSQIIKIYDCRWQIELLFKQLKQNFQLEYFYGESINAIEIQIWVALIANLLMSALIGFFSFLAFFASSIFLRFFLPNQKLFLKFVHRLKSDYYERIYRLRQQRL